MGERIFDGMAPNAARMAGRGPSHLEPLVLRLECRFDVQHDQRRIACESRQPISHRGTGTCRDLAKAVRSEFELVQQVQREMGLAEKLRRSFEDIIDQRWRNEDLVLCFAVTGQADRHGEKRGVFSACA